MTGPGAPQATLQPARCVTPPSLAFRCRPPGCPQPSGSRLRLWPEPTPYEVWLTDDPQATGDEAEAGQ